MKRIFIRICLVIAAAAILAPPAALAQNASRATYSWSKPAQVVTFNSITNNPSNGDERNFLYVRPLNDATYTTDLNVTDGEQLVLRLYYDNDAAANYNLKAKNTRVKFTLPTSTGPNQNIAAYIEADNSQPTLVSSVATINAAQPFNLTYQKGSAQIWNNVLRGNQLPDNVISDGGAMIGYQKLDGTILGGPQYSGYVTIKATVHFAGTSLSTKSVGVVANTGPGNTVGLFLGASLLGAVGHRLARLRRQTV